MFDIFSFFSNKKKYRDTAFDIIICMGQSNCTGYGKGNEELCFLPDEDIFAYNKGRVVKAEERKASKTDVRGVFPLYFAQLYKETCLTENRKILVFNAAKGGTGFTNLRWGIKDDLYRYAVRRTCDMLLKFPAAKLVCVLWHQGEIDAVNSMDVQSYKNKLALLINDFRKKVKADELPFIAGDYVQKWKETCPHSFRIADATQEVVTSIKNCAYVLSDGLDGNDESDIIHFSRKSLKELGRRYFEKYLQLIANK